MTPNNRRNSRKRSGSNNNNTTTATTATNGGQQGETDEALLKRLDQEFLAFHQFCQTSGFSDAEMRQICEPLLSALRRAQLRRALLWGAFMVALSATIWGLAQVGSVALHLSAVGRILMIKMLPVWDWTNLFYDSCLVNNPYYGDYTVTEEDCVTCEALETIDRVTGVSYQQILDGYLQRDAPVVVLDAMDTWPLYLQDERLRDTVPCVMTTNIRTASSDLFAQNCDINAVKALRKYYQRPYFLANTVSPAHFNWVLMSSDYHAKLYKKLRGTTTFRLIPHNACNASCSELVGELSEGEILVFTNYIWTFEYLPGRGTDNVAILTETVWEEMNIY
ncbi:hypothetical protein B566_EDAN006724 [Ephemera danica]|nr:hypothetical protein B566_EDAN006724 [Ephemera danica]